MSDSKLEQNFASFVKSWGPIRWRGQLDRVVVDSDPQLASIFWALSNI